MTVEEKQRQTDVALDPGTSLPVMTGRQTFASVTDQITSIVLVRKTPLFWYCTFAIGMLALGGFLVGLTYLLLKGVGLFGIEIPVAWGFAITNFVWWIGIGHAG